MSTWMRRQDVRMNFRKASQFLLAVFMACLVNPCSCSGIRLSELTRRTHGRTRPSVHSSSRIADFESVFDPGPPASAWLDPSNRRFSDPRVSEYRGDQGAVSGVTEQLMNCTRPAHIPDVAQFFLLGDTWVELNDTDLAVFPPFTRLVFQCRQPGLKIFEGVPSASCEPGGKWSDIYTLRCLGMEREIVVAGLSGHLPQRVEYDGSLTVFLPPLTSDLRLEVTCQVPRPHDPQLLFTNVTLMEGRAGLFSERGDSTLLKMNLTLSPPMESDSGYFTCRDRRGVNSHRLMINFRVRDVKPLHECPEAVIYKTTEIGMNSTMVYWQSPELPNGTIAEISSNFNPGDRFEIGVTMVTVTVTDEHGPLTVCEFEIHVNDTEPPHIENCPNAMNIPVTTEPSKNYANISWTEPTATDNSGKVLLEVVSERMNGSMLPIGPATMTYIARDEAGNENVCSFTITVRDSEPPIIVCPESQRLVLDSNRGTAVVDWPEPESSDNSGNYVMLTHSGAARGQRYSPGVVFVNYTAEDISGNVATCYFRIEIIDKHPPQVMNCPPNRRVFINPLKQDGVSITWDLPIANDNAGEVSLTQTHTSGETFHVGRHMVKLVFTDASGNEAVCRFQINVLEGKCRQISNRNITWDESYPGQNIPSRQLCPLMTENVGQPIANRTCRLRQTIGAMWSPTAVMNGCGSLRENVTVQDILNSTIDEYTVGDVAATLLDTLDKMKETLAPRDVIAITDIIDKVANLNLPSEEILKSIMDTVEMIFMAESEMSPASEIGRAQVSSRIIKALERQVSTLSTFNMTLTIETETIVVRTATVNATTVTEKTVFEIKGADWKTSGNIGLRSKTDVGVPIVRLPLQEIGRKVSKSSGQTADLLHLGFIYYQNPVLFSRAENASGSRDPELVGDIVGGVISASVSNTPLTDLTDDVEIVFPLDPTGNLSQYPATCVFWDYSLTQDGGGGWSTEGVSLSERTNGFIVCKSNHLTHFAVIVDFTGKGDDTDPILDLLTDIGCALSIAGLSATILTFMAFRTLRNSRHRQILINHCLSLLFLYVVFLVGIDSSNIVCMAAAILLHYFMLTTMFWMAVEAHNMYMYLVKVFQRDVRRFILKSTMFAWGTPLVITATSVLVAQEDYKDSNYCFPTPGINLYISLLLPMALVMAHNFVIFSMVVCRLVCTDVAGKAITQSRKQQLVSRLQNAVCMSVLMGLSWSLGFIAAVQPSFLFQLLFCIANSLQGVAVFVLFCLRASDVRSAYKNFLPCLDVELNIRGQSYKVHERPVHQYRSRHSDEVDPMWSGNVDRVSNTFSWPPDTPGLEAYMHLEFERQLSNSNTDSTRVSGNSYFSQRSNSRLSTRVG